jgi:hypothetical protein
MGLHGLLQGYLYFFYLTFKEEEKLEIFNTYTHLSMALQSFVEPWPLFQFIDPIHSR